MSKVNIFWEGLKILRNLLRRFYAVPVKSTVENMQFFFAFSEYMDFMICNIFFKTMTNSYLQVSQNPQKNKMNFIQFYDGWELWKVVEKQLKRKDDRIYRLYQNLFLKVFLLYQSCNIQPKVIFSPLLKINWFGAGIGGNSSCNPSNLDSKVRLSSWKL
jgi:hypothetical protein